MKILFLNHNVAWRGGFFRAYHWGHHLARRGHHITLLTISENNLWRFEIQERDGIVLVKTPDLLFGRLRSGWDVWDTMRRIGYLLPLSFDLVHSVDSRPACILPALVLKKLRRTKLVVDWGDWWGRGGTIVERSTNLTERLFAPVETFFEEGFRGYADGSVVLNSALERRALELGVAAHSIVRIPHGADIEGIVPLEKNAARKELGVSPEMPVLGYVGAMFERDADLMIHAFEIMQAQDLGVMLFLIGNTKVRLPRRFLDSGSVIVTGSLSYKRLQLYIACCDVMLLPLRNSVANRGRWPSKISDYLAAGKPVVACRVGDIAPLIEEGRCGVLTHDSPEDFATKTVEILRQHDLLEEMGRNARKVAETKLDWRLLTDQLERFYLYILNERIC
jgi:glycosyltransferase involved in cell wall biosynthesis